MARDDDARLSERRFTSIEPKSAFRQFRVMTFEAGALENGENLAREVYRCGAECRRKTQN